MTNTVSTCNFLKTAGGSVLNIDYFRMADNNDDKVKDELSDNNKSNVFFTNNISVRGLVKIYSYINLGINGKVGIKLHTGEPHGPNLLPIESRSGFHQIEYMNTLGMGNIDYKLIEIE